MKITGRVETEAVVDVSCDVCGSSTRLETGSLQYGVLHAHWGFGALHDGERYEVHLCEPCFFQTIAYLKTKKKRSKHKHSPLLTPILNPPKTPTH